jgi:putative DNA primase/helicase
MNVLTPSEVFESQAAIDVPQTMEQMEALVYGSFEAWPEPEGLGPELPSVPAFDAGLLPDSFRPMVEDVADRMQIPMDFPAVVAVATLAGLCGRRAVIQPKAADTSWVVVPNLWGAIVAGPGAMKSPVISAVTAPARMLESDWRAEHAQAMKAYEAALERAELDRAVWREQYKRAAKKGEGMAEMQQSAPAKPPQRRLIASDATFESLHQLLAENPAGMLVLRDELSGWLAGLDTQGREAERAFYLECWSGDSGFTIDRIGRGMVHAEHVCVSLFGGIQPGRLRAYLADALRDGPSNDGLMQRFQLLVWPDLGAEWYYRDRRPNVAAMRAAENVFQRVSLMDASSPHRMGFAPDAQELFVAMVTDLEKRIRSDNESTIMQAHLSKYRKLMPALSLLFSLADNTMEAVSLRHAQQAADWCDYLESHARRVYSARIAPEQLAALALAKRLRKGWKREEARFSIRDVYRNGWSGMENPEEARAAVRVLESAGWLRAIKTATGTGRPSENFTINPKIGGTHFGE